MLLGVTARSTASDTHPHPLHSTSARVTNAARLHTLWQAGARSPIQVKCPYALCHSAPLACARPTQAEALWSPLLYDNLDTGVESEDVTSFCEQLLTSLRAVAEEQAEQGSAESSEGEEGACEMCERVMKLTKHHLIPRYAHVWRTRQHVVARCRTLTTCSAPNTRT